MSSPIRPPLTVKTIDGTTEGRPINTIRVTNGDLSISGTVATIDTSGSGGSGTVTSVGLTETGTALTITGSPITGAGTFNIAGAGTSSQVILGDLSLGTLTSGTVTSVSSSQAFITITNPTTAASISIGNASASATGVLTAADWTLFNSKGSGTVTSVTGTSPIVSSGGTTPAISLANTTVTPGSYTTADITVDAQGRITAASTGSGGASPGGSDSQIQYNNGGAFGGSSVMTFDDTAAAEQVLFTGTSSKAIFKVEQLGAGNSIEVHDAATDTTIFLVDQYGRAAIKTNAVSSGYDLTVGGSSFIQGHLKLSTTGTTANPAIKWDGDLTTGINRPATGEIAIVASGVETFRFGADGDFEIVGDAGTSGQVFTSGGAGAAASWTTVSGGGIGGSITDNQVSVGATTADEIEGYSDFTYDNSLDTLTVGEKIESSGTSQLNLVAGSSSIAILDGGVANHINITPGSGRLNAQSSTLSVGTGSADTTISSNGAHNLTLNTNDGTNSGSIVITDGVNGQISITPNGTGKIKLDGVEIDNSAIATGYILKASSATAAGWAAESGGGTDNTPGIPTGNADLYQEWLGFGGQAGLVGAGNSNVVSYQWSNSATRIRPHVISKTGTLGVAAINVTAVPTTVTAQEVRIGLYKSDSDGGVGDLKAVATISVSASTGVLTGSYVAETGEDLSVTRGELYWAGFYSTYASAADAMTVSMNATNSLPTMRLDLDTTPIAGQTYWKTGDFPEPYTAGSNPSDGQGQTWLMMGTTIT